MDDQLPAGDDSVGGDSADDSVDDDSVDGEGVQPIQVDVAALSSSSWSLRVGSGPDGEISLVDGWPITLSFDHEDGLFGTSACNGYGGSYKIDGSQIRVANLVWNDAGCAAAVQQSERSYLAALSDVDGIDLAGDKLALSGTSTKLLFDRTEPIPIEQIFGRVWLLEATINDGQATDVQGNPASLTIDKSGTLAAGTGCRSLSGSYIVSDNKILLTSSAADGECPTSLSDQDSQVVAVLGDGFVPELKGEALTLRSVGNEGLRYRATTEKELSGLSKNPVPTDAEIIDGVEWIFSGGDGPEGPISDPRSVNPDRTITLTLGDGRYSGNAVCNGYRGEADIGIGRLTLGPAASTKVGCGDVFNAITAAYHRALTEMTEFGLEADMTRLVMSNNATELRFERAQTPN